MVSHSRHQRPPLIRRLGLDATSFNYFAALRILEASAGVIGADPENLRRVVSIHAHISMGFQGADLRSVEITEGGIPRLTMNFMGIAGAHGPLPMVYTQMALHLSPATRAAFQRFLDIFNQRLAAILWLNGVVGMPGLAQKPADQTAYGMALRSFLGLGTPGTQGRLPFPERSLFPYTALFWGRVKSKEGLRLMIADYFEVEAEVTDFEGMWWPIAPDQRTRIGQTGAFRALGQTSFAGKRIWLPQNAFTVHLGSLDFDSWQAFLPIGDRFWPMNEMVRLYTGDTFRITLSMPQAKVPQRPLSAGVHLGWTSWAKAQSGGEGITTCRLVPPPLLQREETHRVQCPTPVA